MRLSALFTAIALISQTIPLSGTAAERFASPSVQDIQQSLRFIPDRMAYYHVPGLSLACIHNGTVEWTQLLGVAGGGGERVRPEIFFQAISMGRRMTAVGVVGFGEREKLNLDVDVNQSFRSGNLPANKFTE